MRASEQIAVGSVVRVVRTISPSETPLRRGKREWTLVRYSKPHGYAVLEGHGETWHVHPESLQVVAAPAPEDETPRCVVCRTEYPTTGQQAGSPFALVGKGFVVCERCVDAGRRAKVEARR